MPIYSTTIYETYMVASDLVLSTENTTLTREHTKLSALTELRKFLKTTGTKIGINNLPPLLLLLSLLLLSLTFTLVDSLRQLLLGCSENKNKWANKKRKKNTKHDSTSVKVNIKWTIFL